MRVSINSVIVAALLSGIPFAGVVQIYPIGGTSDIEVFSKRGREVPILSPSIRSCGRCVEGFADGELNLGNAVQESQRARGEQLLQSLDTAILHNSGSDKIDKSMKDAGYIGQSEGRQVMPPVGPKNYLKDFNIETKNAFLQDNIKKPGGEIIVETFEDPKQKVLIVTKSWNKNRDPEGALSWTAMVMSNWRNGATLGKVDVKDLKYVVRNQVQAIDTTTSNGVKLNSVNAINGAFDALNADKAKTLTLDVKTQDKMIMQQVLIMSAQTHVARVIQMLQDYRNELGNLNIVRLHLQTPNKPVSDSQYNIIIELGH